MRNRFRTPLAAGVLSLAVCSTAAAADYDEGIDGDLSGNAGAPTPVTFDVGSNLVSGSMVAGADTRDILTFTIPAGQALASLNQIEFVDIILGGFANTAYHALDDGPTTVNPGFGTAGQFLGGAHLGTLPSGFDLLPALSDPNIGTNGSGFDLPLGPGTYTYIIQQTSPDLTGYTLDFVIEESNDWTDEGNALAGTLGDPLLTASGQLEVGVNNDVVLSNTLPGSQAGLFLALASNPVPFKGGTLVPNPFFDIIIVPTNGAGEIPLSFSLTSALPIGTELWVQWGVQDAGAVNGIALSNAVKGLVD